MLLALSGTCGVLCLDSDSSEYLQHYSHPTNSDTSPPHSLSTGTVPLSFPRPNEAMVVLSANEVQRAADPLAPFGGRVPRMTDNTVTMVAGASRKNTAYAKHSQPNSSRHIHIRNWCVTVTAVIAYCVCLSVGVAVLSVCVAACPVPAGSLPTSVTISGLGPQWRGIARSVKSAR